MENFRLRTLVVLLGIVITFVWFMPNILDTDKNPWPTHSKLNYGLDIQGGLHLVMGADVDKVVTEQARRMISRMQEDMKRAGIEVEAEVLNGPIGEIKVKFKNKDQMAGFEEKFQERWGSELQQMEKGEDFFIYRYFESFLTTYKDRVIEQSIETLRNRIDAFGVTEPVIAKQGVNRILIQLPGLKNAEAAKQVISTTAKLDFMIVSSEKSSEELQKLVSEVELAGKYTLAQMKYSDYVQRVNVDLKAKLPDGTMVLFEKAPNASKMELGSIPLLVRTDTNLGGDALADAFVSYDQYGNPIVSMRFDATGANLFADISGANVGKQMAIVLDNVVRSAPVLKERIGGGQAQITLGGRGQDAMEEAKMIAMVLRAGALPASLEQLEERNVGPTLGKDSVDRAKMATMIGAIIIAIFMVVYYKSMGLISDIVLGVNILMILALLSSFGATLTLPGIAGIALTIGMAVDANVLINERMREELKRGLGFTSAVKESYEKAFSAIFDANITTGATAAVLLNFGTGPVRGFAVTLLIGIFTTLFTNVFMSKYIVDVLVHKRKVQKLSV